MVLAGLNWTELIIIFFVALAFGHITWNTLITSWSMSFPKLEKYQLKGQPNWGDIAIIVALVLFVIWVLIPGTPITFKEAIFFGLTLSLAINRFGRRTSE